jgi:hypothetical protein
MLIPFLFYHSHPQPSPIKGKGFIRLPELSGSLPGAGNCSAVREKVNLISAIPVNFLIKSHLQISKPGIIFRSSSENDTFWVLKK